MIRLGIVCRIHCLANQFHAGLGFAYWEVDTPVGPSPNTIVGLGVGMQRGSLPRLAVIWTNVYTVDTATAPTINIYLPSKCVAADLDMIILSFELLAGIKNKRRSHWDILDRLGSIIVRRRQIQ